MRSVSEGSQDGSAHHEPDVGPAVGHTAWVPAPQHKVEERGTQAREGGESHPNQG